VSEPEVLNLVDQVAEEYLTENPQVRDAVLDDALMHALWRSTVGQMHHVDTWHRARNWLLEHRRLVVQECLELTFGNAAGRHGALLQAELESAPERLRAQARAVEELRRAWPMPMLLDTVVPKPAVPTEVEVGGAVFRWSGREWTEVDTPADGV